MDADEHSTGAPNGGSSITRGAATRLGLMAMLGTGTLLGEACSSRGIASTPVVAQTNGQDLSILNALATAEALASVMYDNVIKTSPAYVQLGNSGNTNDQAYLAAGRQQEAEHFDFLVSMGGKPLATQFYFPTNMFTDATYATTIDTITLLEDAFIASYLIGIRDFSTNALKQFAGQILGVEAEHRAFARVIAADLGLGQTTGLSGIAEQTNGLMYAANNLSFERTFSDKFTSIADVVTTLGSFTKAGAAGYDPTAYTYNAARDYYLDQSPVVSLTNTSPS